MCGHLGHKKFACPKNRSKLDKAQVATVPVDREVVLMPTRGGIPRSKKPSEIEWILDSGASRHIACDEEIFHETSEFDVPVVIDSAKKCEKLLRTKAGTVKGKVHVNGNVLMLSLGHVLLVKNLKYNLMSLSHLLKSGVKVDFMPDRAMLFKNGEQIGEAKLRGSLYFFKKSCVTPEAAMFAKDVTGELELDKVFEYFKVQSVQKEFV